MLHPSHHSLVSPFLLYSLYTDRGIWHECANSREGREATVPPWGRIEWMDGRGGHSYADDHPSFLPLPSQAVPSTKDDRVNSCGNQITPSHSATSFSFSIFNHLFLLLLFSLILSSFLLFVRMFARKRIVSLWDHPLILISLGNILFQLSIVFVLLCSLTDISSCGTCQNWVDNWGVYESKCVLINQWFK